MHYFFFIIKDVNANILVYRDLMLTSGYNFNN